MHRLLIVAGIGICLLAVTCSRNSVGIEGISPQQPIAADTQDGATLPTPGSLTRSSSDVPQQSEGRVKLGSDSDLGLSLNSIPGGGTAYSVVDLYRRWFIPELSDQIGNGIPVAYNGYSFRPIDYSGPLDFCIEWETPPLAEDLFVALADFSKNAWQWFEVDDPAHFTVDDDPGFHNSEGEIYLVLFLTNERTLLKWIKLGSENAAPFAGFNVDSATAPRGPVLFDSVLDTLDVDGEIVKREFDFDGDAVFEADNGTEPKAIHVFDSEGVHTVSMRATDNDGLSAVASMDITVNNWQSEIIDSGSFGGFEIDQADTMHVLYSVYDKVEQQAHECYSSNPGDGWHTEPVDETILQGDHCVLFKLDRNGIPTVLCRGGGYERMIQRTISGWQPFPVPSYDFDLPENPAWDLEFDSANLPHFAAGTHIIGGPGDVPPAPNAVRYWKYDGYNWVLEYEHLNFGEWFGLELDGSDTPYLGFNSPDDTSKCIFAFYDAAQPGWNEEQLPERNLGNSLLEVADDGTVHLVSKTSGVYLTRQAGEWRVGPSPGLPGTDMALYDDGSPHLLQCSDALVQYSALSGAIWEAEIIKSGGFGTLTGLIRTTSNGQVHVIGITGIVYDRRYQQLYPDVRPDARIMHYWK